MARIRSIHPGIKTDEAYMSASFGARLLVIGLWMESFDDGVFEWKPMTLKARIFPADQVDMQALLDELVDLRFITRFDANGKPYGAIRNFQKYQKPKRPNSSGVLPDALRSYVGAPPTSSEPVPNMSGTSSEHVPPGGWRMEDGGWKREEGENPLPPSAAGSASGSGEAVEQASQPPPKQKRATRLPEDWAPNKRDREAAAELGVAGSRLEWEASKFRDYWVARDGRDGRKLDWSATWRNWIRRAVEGGKVVALPAGPHKPKPRRMTVDEHPDFQSWGNA